MTAKQQKIAKCVSAKLAKGRVNKQSNPLQKNEQARKTIKQHRRKVANY